MSKSFAISLVAGTWSISGTVTPAAAGSGATVALSGAATLTTTANASGIYSFTGLANGTYLVTPSKSGFAFTPANKSVVINSANAASINFTGSGTALQLSNLSCAPSALQSQASAVCTVSLTGAAPSGGFAVAIGYSTTSVVTITIPASVTVAAGATTGTFSVKAGAITSNSSLTVTAAGGGVSKSFTISLVAGTWTISGAVTPSSAGSGATIALSGAAALTTTADASGNYSFSGLPNGTYLITPSKSGFAFTPTNKSVVINSANAASINFTGALAAAGLMRDAQVSVDQNSASSTVTSPVFSTKASNELLLAFVSTDYSSGPNTTVNSISGGGLTWVLVARANAQSGTAEIWRAFSASPLSAVSVSASLSLKVASSLTVVSISGVDTTGTNGSGAIGAIRSSSSGSGAPSASLVTTRNNSLVIGVGNDFDNAISRTPGSNQTVLHQLLASVGDTYWAQVQNYATPLSGTTVTINDNAPTGDRYNLAICEILPAK